MSEDYWLNDEALDDEQIGEEDVSNEKQRFHGKTYEAESGRTEKDMSLDKESLIADILSKPRALALILELAERPKTVAELCRAVKASETSIRHYVNTLSTAGLLVRVKAIDGRKKYLKLTVMGRELVNAVLIQLNKRLIESCSEKNIKSHGTTYNREAEILIESSCAEELLEDFSRNPTKLLRSLGYKERKYGYLVPPKKLSIGTAGE